ncbi:MAG: hypothetical protein ACRD12_16515 [Acidimicrobiales bacterium]
MPDETKVTVRVDENGEIVDLDIDGDIDRDNLTEERPSQPAPSPRTDEFINQQNTRWFG